MRSTRIFLTIALCAILNLSGISSAFATENPSLEGGVVSRTVDVSTNDSYGLGVDLGHGWFLTAYHVVKSDKRHIRVNGYDATLVHRGSDRNDWALLHADNYNFSPDWLGMTTAEYGGEYFVYVEDHLETIKVVNKYDKFKFSFSGFTPYAGLSGSGVYNADGDLVGILTHSISHRKNCNGSSCTLEVYITGLIVPLQEEMFKKAPEEMNEEEVAADAFGGG